MTGTSGRQRVQQDVLQSHKIMLPPLHEQKAIAATLSALDDMIELNNQINKTLEEMAQAIFKSWFVDFEPFKDGEFEESELGLIPKGWRVVELGEITEEIRERVKDRKIPVFSAVKTGDLVLSEDYFTKQVFSRDISKYIVVKPFDFAYNPARINIGSIGINEFSYTGCVSPVYVVFRTDQKYKWFFKMLTRTERFKKEVNTRASGSVRQTLNFDEFSKIKVVYPYAEIVEEYNYIFEGLIMAKSKIEEEISILSEIRDTLLPKLMSGEIRVPVEEVI
jgi:type I restriction enzyme S subunit